MYTQPVGYLFNGDTFETIQSVFISEVILNIICTFGTNESVLIKDVLIERFHCIIVGCGNGCVLSIGHHDRD
jgi:hypothetical protein